MSKRLLTLTMALMLALTILPAIAIADEAVEPFSIMVPLWYTEAPTNETETIVRLGEIAGVKLDLQWVPSDSYQEKINTAIASGDVPDALTILDPKHATYVNAARAGMFWDLTDKLENYEFYTRTDPLIVNNAKLDGKNYYIPRTRMLTRAAILYRKDWLENLKLDPPKTMEDVYTIAKAFKENDPDGNGANDTLGLISAYQSNSGDIWGFNTAVVYHGGPNQYRETEDGTLIPSFETPEHQATLDWYRKLYEEGIMNQDFATIMQEKGFELMAAGQGGICIAQSDELENRFDALVKLVKTQDESLELLDVMAFEARIEANGEIGIIGGSGFYGGYAFPVNKVTSEERLDKLMKAFDLMDIPEAQDIIQWGIEGVHHEIVDGLPVLFEDQQAWITDCCTLQQLGTTWTTSKLYKQGVRTPVQAAYIADQMANTPYAVGDPTVPLISDTNSTKGPELKLLLGDAYVKYIMGEIDLDGLRAEYDKWYAQGGTQIMEEFNAGFALTR